MGACAGSLDRPRFQEGPDGLLVEHSQLVQDFSSANVLFGRLLNGTWEAPLTAALLLRRRRPCTLLFALASEKLRSLKQLQLHL
jgi:hypothetical protein